MSSRAGPDGLRSEGPEDSQVKQLIQKTALAAKRLRRDERGAEVLEYALILGLIVVTAIVIIGTVGTKVLARWTSVNSKI